MILKVCTMSPYSHYWNKRYLTKDTPWDAKSITTPMKRLIDAIPNKNAKILIPGMGYGYEVEYLFRQGFTQVYGLDFAKETISQFVKRVPDFPSSQLIQGDFFQLIDQFDYILEQTFFSALPKIHHQAYFYKMKELLAPDGVFTGVWFAFEEEKLEPPFGYPLQTFRNFIGELFSIDILEICTFSIKPRSGTELFFKLTHKK